MKRTSKGASAPKFLVIESFPTCTKYTGTKEQLIDGGFANSDQFPEGKKRLKWYLAPGVIHHPDEFQMKKIKGGRFELKKWHENRVTVTKTDPWLKVSLETNEAGYFNWSLYGVDDIEELKHGSSYSALAEAARLIVDTVQYERYQSRINRLSVVISSRTQQLSAAARLAPEVQHG
jgi:hypothetical protein